MGIKREWYAHRRRSNRRRQSRMEGSALGSSHGCCPPCVLKQEDRTAPRVTQGSSQVHWTPGWSSVFANWLNPKKNKLLTSLWQEVALHFAARAPPPSQPPPPTPAQKLGFPCSKAAGTWGLCLCCWPHCRDGPRSLRKTVLGSIVSKRIL